VLDFILAANPFAVVHQLRYSAKDEKSLDIVLLLNGVPIFTAELKNLLNGQDVEDAIRQYKTDRDPREPLLAYGRCLAHFAVDPDLVYVTTPARRAADPVPAVQPGEVRRRRQPARAAHPGGYATGYLWLKASRQAAQPPGGPTDHPLRCPCSTTATRWRKRTTRAGRRASAT
jgi:type I restriction enzyme R subunit